MILSQLFESDILPGNVLSAVLGKCAALAALESTDKGEDIRWVSYSANKTSGNTRVWFEMGPGTKIKSIFPRHLKGAKAPSPIAITKTSVGDEKIYYFEFALKYSEFKPSAFKRGWDSVEGSAGITMDID